MSHSRLPPIRSVGDGGDGEDVEVSPPHPGDDRVLAQVLHTAVNVSVCPSEGEHRDVALAAPEPRHLHPAHPGGNHSGGLG